MSRDSIGRNAPRFSRERCASAMIAACAAFGANAPNGGAAGSLAAAMPGGVADMAKMFSLEPCDGQASDLPLDHHQLEFGDGLGRIEALRAGLGAVQDGVAAIEPARVLEIIEPLAGGLIAAVLDPSCRLQQRGRAEIAVAVPPIARARGRAAGAEDAFIEAVELFAVLVALPPFLLRRRR